MDTAPQKNGRERKDTSDLGALAAQLKAISSDFRKLVIKARNITEDAYRIRAKCNDIANHPLDFH